MLVIIFCYSGVRPTVPFFNYIINFEYIAEVLCINKEKEPLQCNGSCQLTKEILDNESEGTSEYPQPSCEKFPNLFLEKQTAYSYRLTSFSKQNVYYTFFVRYKNKFQKPLLPPPQFVI